MDAKRGYVPEDDRNFSHEAIEKLKIASRHIMFSKLQDMGVGSVNVLLDEPVSNSGRLKALMADVGEEFPFGLDIQVIKQVDKMLWEKENVITSDSVILDHCKSWVNLMKACVDEQGATTIRVWEWQKNIA